MKICFSLQSKEFMVRTYNILHTHERVKALYSCLMTNLVAFEVKRIIFPNKINVFEKKGPCLKDYILKTFYPKGRTERSWESLLALQFYDLGT